MAVIGRCSPTTARAEKDPQDTTGATSEMPRRRSARPVIAPTLSRSRPTQHLGCDHVTPASPVGAVTGRVGWLPSGGVPAISLVSTGASSSSIHRPCGASRTPDAPVPARHESPVVLAPGDARPLRGARPRALAELRRRPGQGAGGGLRRAAGSAGQGPQVHPPAAGRRRRPAGVPRPTPRWYQSLGAEAPASIAYFSAEFGITEVLPQYSGGLGILAGDHLKAASDLGVPLIGVGLLYRAGYFAQCLSADGWQLEHYPSLDPTACRSKLLRQADGSAVVITVPLPEGRTLHAHVWRAQVGRVSAAAARQRHRGERAGRARGHRPALRRRRGPPPPPGDAARHRRRACGARLLRAHRHPAARGVPRQRGPRGLPGRGADPRADGGARADLRRRRCRPSAPAPCSPRTPRCRPASTGSRRH